MAITINGTTGIAGVGGSSSTPAVQGTDSNTGVFFPAADTVSIATNGTEQVRVDSSGNVGIGTSSPSQKLTVNGQINMPAATTEDRAIEIGAGRTGNGYSYIDFIGDATHSDFALRIIRDNTGPNANSSISHRGTGSLVINTAEAAPIVFNTSTTERMRIDASGKTLVGRTTAYGDGSIGTPTFQANGVAGSHGAMAAISNSTASTILIGFVNPNGTVGYVTTSGTTTSYVSVSDYRLKENVAPMQNALDKIAQLNPVTYTWKADGSDGQGFIAHELQAVVPDCVSGEKDAVDAEGKPKYQGVDTSFLVGILTKAIQEQQAMIQALQADIAALKGV